MLLPPPAPLRFRTLVLRRLTEITYCYGTLTAPNERVTLAPQAAKRSLGIYKLLHSLVTICNIGANAALAHKYRQGLKSFSK